MSECVCVLASVCSLVCACVSVCELEHVCGGGGDGGE